MSAPAPLGSASGEPSWPGAGRATRPTFSVSLPRSGEAKGLGGGGGLEPDSREAATLPNRPVDASRGPADERGRAAEGKVDGLAVTGVLSATAFDTAICGLAVVEEETGRQLSTVGPSMRAECEPQNGEGLREEGREQLSPEEHETRPLSMHSCKQRYTTTGRPTRADSHLDRTSASRHRRTAFYLSLPLHKRSSAASSESTRDAISGLGSGTAASKRVSHALRSTHVPRRRPPSPRARPSHGRALGSHVLHRAARAEGWLNREARYGPERGSDRGAGAEQWSLGLSFGLVSSRRAPTRAVV